MNPILLFLLLLTSEYVDSFHCYFTNFDDLDTFDKSAQPVAADCKTHVSNQKPTSLGASGSDRDLDISLWCYMISFEAKFENGTEDVRIQLCDYSDRCDHFVEKIERLRLFIVSNMTCVGCEGNLCNSNDVGNEIEIGSDGETNSYRRNLSIGAGGCGVVGGIGALIRLLCCRKSKNSKSVCV